MQPNIHVPSRALFLSSRSVDTMDESISDLANGVARYSSFTDWIPSSQSSMLPGQPTTVHESHSFTAAVGDGWSSLTDVVTNSVRRASAALSAGDDAVFARLRNENLYNEAGVEISPVGNTLSFVCDTFDPHARVPARRRSSMTLGPPTPEPIYNTINKSRSKSQTNLPTTANYELASRAQHADQSTDPQERYARPEPLPSGVKAQAPAGESKSNPADPQHSPTGSRESTASEHSAIQYLMNAIEGSSNKDPSTESICTDAAAATPVGTTLTRFSMSGYSVHESAVVASPEIMEDPYVSEGVIANRQSQISVLHNRPGQGHVAKSFAFSDVQPANVSSTYTQHGYMGHEVAVASAHQNASVSRTLVNPVERVAPISTPQVAGRDALHSAADVADGLYEIMDGKNSKISPSDVTLDASDT